MPRDQTSLAKGSYSRFYCELHYVSDPAHCNLIWAGVIKGPSKAPDVRAVWVEMAKPKVGEDRTQPSLLLVDVDEDVGALKVLVADPELMERFNGT